MRPSIPPAARPPPRSSAPPLAPNFNPWADYPEASSGQVYRQVAYLRYCRQRFRRCRMSRPGGVLASFLHLHSPACLYYPVLVFVLLLARSRRPLCLLTYFLPSFLPSLFAYLLPSPPYRFHHPLVGRPCSLRTAASRLDSVALIILIN